jgi:uncharacterized protein
MISLQELFGRDDKFFGLLEASAEEGRASVQALKRLLESASPQPQLEDFIQSRRREKQLAQRISEEIIRSFYSTLEREDIETLSHALYRVPKTIEKFAERYLICAQYVRSADFTKQVSLLEQATDQVVVMVKSLRHPSHLEEVRQLNQRLQQLEGEADNVILELLRDLYSGRHEPYRVIALKELYELLERVIDRCRDAGTVVTHITLKHA